MTLDDIQDYDESDALDSIWSTREKAKSRLDEMDADSAAYIKKTGYFKQKICSEAGWSIQEHQIDKGGARGMLMADVAEPIVRQFNCD